MASDLDKQLGRRVRQLRQQQGLTLDQLAETSGIAPQSISRFERGRSAAAVRTLDRLASGLGVPLHQLFVDGEVAEADAHGIPVEVRGVALLLRDASPGMVKTARRVLEALLAHEAGDERSAG